MMQLRRPRQEDGEGRYGHRGCRLGVFPIVVLIGVLASAALATAQSGSEPLDKIEKAFRAILTDLGQAEKSDLRAETLTRSLRRLETLLARVRVEYQRYPERHSERDRIEFHLGFMIKWTRYLLQRAGSNPDERAPESGREETYRRGVALLQVAKRHEKEHAEDRAGIVQRYLEALPLLRGRREEREILDRVNRIWDEVRGSEKSAGNPEEAAPAEAAPVPANVPAAAPPEAKDRSAPAAEGSAPRTAEDLKQLREDLLEGPKEKRIAAAEALATVNQSWVGGFLVQRLADEGDADVRKGLTKAVLRVGDRHVVRALGKWAKFKEAERKREAIGLLAKIGGQETEKALTLFVMDKDLETIRVLIRAAKSLDKGYGVPTLARAAKQHPSLRFEIIEALGATRDPSGAKVLVSFLHRRKFAEYKDPAMKALRMLGPQAIPTLIDALEGRDYRQWSAAALRSVTGQRFGMSPTPWRQWWKTNRKRLLGDDG